MSSASLPAGSYVATYTGEVGGNPVSPSSFYGVQCRFFDGSSGLGVTGPVTQWVTTGPNYAGYSFTTAFNIPASVTLEVQCQTQISGFAVSGVKINTGQMTLVAADSLTTLS